MKKTLWRQYFTIVVSGLCALCLISADVQAAGLFGAPQTVSREAGGLNTAIGYRYHEETYEKGPDLRFKQNEIYSQASYGVRNTWEIYGRVGISDLNIADVFRENETVFTTLGGKAFCPISEKIGIGAFIQGTYYLNDFTDQVGRGKKIKVQDLWDVNAGIALQTALPCGTKLYAGPYLYYSEAELWLSSGVSDLGYTAGKFSIHNKLNAGGFAGLDIPLAKGFRLNVEGQYADRFSAGAAVSYTY